MKTIFLILFTFGLIGFTVFLSADVAYGLWIPKSTEKLLEQSETVFVGTVTMVKELKFERSNEFHIEENGVTRIEIENYTQTLDEYTVNIEEFLKNPQESNTITMLEATVGGVPGRSVSIGGFEVNDRVLFFVPKIDGTNQYSPESFAIPRQCDATSVLEQSRVFLFNDFKIMQNGVEKNDDFVANKPIEFVYNKDLNTLEGSSFDVDINIRKIIDNKWETALDEQIHAEINPCEWTGTASWEFVPTGGRYSIQMYTSEGDGNGGESVSGGFTVKEFDFPLKQFKSGVPADQIQCNDSLVLVTKNNGSPACVKEQTLLKLVERKLIITSIAERDLMLDAGYKLYPGVGWVPGVTNNELTSKSEPEPLSLTERNLIDANDKLREIYQINPSLGPFHFQDVIVGHGIGDGNLIVDVLDKFYDSVESRELIIDKIVDITNGKVDIDFSPSDGVTPKDIESVFQYVWNRYLHQHNIEFSPQERSYANTDEGYHSEKDNKVCSPLVSSSGTEFYISSTFTHEPFKITGTFIHDTVPDDCQKIWKTDVILLEPDRILGLWINDFFNDGRNNVLFTEYSISEIDSHYSLDEPVTFEFTETGFGDPCTPIKIVYYQDRVWMENIVIVDKIIRDCPVGTGDEFLSFTFNTSKDAEFGKQGEINFPHAGEYFVEITNENQLEGKVVASFVVE